MNNIYQSAQETATRLLAEYGQSASLISITDGEYDVETGTKPQIETAIPVNVVKQNYQNREVDGSLIKRGDVRLLMEAGQEPKTGDVVAFYNKRWTVIHVDPVDPAGTVILYRVQVRA